MDNTGLEMIVSANNRIDMLVNTRDCGDYELAALAAVELAYGKMLPSGCEVAIFGGPRFAVKRRGSRNVAIEIN